MSFDKIKELFLFDKYELNVYLIIENNKPIKGRLIINEKEIKLEVYNTPYDLKFNYDKLYCEYDNYNIELINLSILEYSTSFYSETKDIVYNIEKFLFNEYSAQNEYKKIRIKSKDINTWVGFTKFQHELANDIYKRAYDFTTGLFKNIKCNNFNFSIIYCKEVNQDIFNGITTYKYLPYFELNFQNNLKFKEVENIYFELLDFFYLLLGFDLDVEQVVFESEQNGHNKSYFYYKKDYELMKKDYIFISLANDLFEQYRESLKLEILPNYFELGDYKKTFFKAFRKYKMFHYTEDKFLGYFRILENLMFDKKEKFTEKMLDIYIYNITINEKEKQKEKQILLEGNDKIEKTVDKPIIYRKEKIKFIIFHSKFINVLSGNYKLKVNFTDVEKIVKLRNDISHFNDYKIIQNDLERYIDYLEFLVNYVLLRLIQYSDESFLNNISFYPYKHRVFDFENN
ncbi:hypothetical protein L5F35_10020 [Aliarcobacter butzleri]|uniref:hypothetical protein n=1 Tax=Aliarcobacter butzleri TaxID=28197 RepID=UPI001EDABC94|nr:hypothetical protein [Aliarcobacter butzleri]MCG3686548.1 hypothetical protein [Aliarcobacter butzleri]